MQPNKAEASDRKESLKGGQGEGKKEQEHTRYKTEVSTTRSIGCHSRGVLNSAFKPRHKAAKAYKLNLTHYEWSP